MSDLLMGVPLVPAVPGASAGSDGGGTPGTDGTLSERLVTVGFTVNERAAVHIVLALRLLWLALPTGFRVKAGGGLSSRFLLGLWGGTRPRRGFGDGLVFGAGSLLLGSFWMSPGLAEAGAVVW